MLELVSIFLATKLHIIVILIAFVAIAFASDFQRLRTLVLASIALPLVFLTSRTASLLFENPRPFLEHDFVPLITHAADNGFPSDHALFVFAVASIVFTFNKPVGFGLFVLAVLVGVGRVLVGVHHVIDILGSLVIATGITFIITELIQLFLHKTGPNETRLL
jgi:undecaprenyl-diphosphatase